MAMVDQCPSIASAVQMPGYEAADVAFAGVPPPLYQGKSASGAERVQADIVANDPPCLLQLLDVFVR